MRKVLTAKEMRAVDSLTTERFGVPSLTLMENAALAVTGEIASIFERVAGLRIAVICGQGNNGGDGAAIARLLAGMGANVSAFLVGRVEETRGDARLNFERLLERSETNLGFRECDADLQVREFLDGLWDSSPDVIVDALFGTGLKRPLEGIHAAIVDALSEMRDRPNAPLIVSVDLPSGLDADRQESIGPAVHADVTVTFTAPKLANVMLPASQFSGRLVVADIGSPKELIDESPSQTFVAGASDVREWLEATEFESESYKGKRGHALFIAGSGEYPGAAALAANAAMMSGLGRVTLATAASARDSVASRLVPEVIIRGVAEDAQGVMGAASVGELAELLGSGPDAVEIGSGLTSDREATRALVRTVVDSCAVPLVIDADGLNALSPFEAAVPSGRSVVLTPHEGEFLRLLGREPREGVPDRVDAVRRFATEKNVTLVLKGSRNLVGAPDGRVAIIPTGNPGVGKAGGGDTLAGVVTGFIAQGARCGQDVFASVTAAVYIAGLAGDIAEEKWGKRVMLASDVRDSLSDAFLSVSR